MRHRNPLAIANALLLGLALAGCSSMDPADWFNTKKPLPGERSAVFPGGVPGVPQGVPPELVQGYQPPPEPPPQVAEAPPEPPKPKPVAKPKPKPKPKPKQVAAPARPTAITVQPPQQATTQSARPAPRQAGAQPAPSPAPGQPAAQSAPWPAPQQTASQPAQPQSQSPFPDPPPPGTFSR
jgi:hypothetical protein